MNDLQRKGAVLLGILNDLKRNDEVAARELGVTPEEVRAWICGKREMPRSVIEKAARMWPVNIRDFEVFNDDAPTGVVIMRADESAKSERVLARGGRDYYAYRDTAMSRTAPFRPEWILELVEVDSNDPNDARVEWNNGHFLHQFTYFIGPVNFYFIENGLQRVAEMNTGDTMYITPFIPHSFTTRKNPAGTRGLILALTFGGRLWGDPQQELSVLESEKINAMLTRSIYGSAAQKELIKRNMRNAAVSESVLVSRLGVAKEHVAKWLSGDVMPTFEELVYIARALGMNLRDLLAYDRGEPAVVVRRVSETNRWLFGRYNMRELAGTSYVPDMKAFEIRVPQEAAQKHDLETSLFQYGYIFGDKPVTLMWCCDGKEYRETLAPNDSFVMKPCTPHQFFAESGEDTLLVLRVGGRISPDVLLELSALGSANIQRIIAENTQWYNPKGSRGI